MTQGETSDVKRGIGRRTFVAGSTAGIFGTAAIGSGLGNQRVEAAIPAAPVVAAGIALGMSTLDSRFGDDPDDDVVDEYNEAYDEMDELESYRQGRSIATSGLKIRENVMENYGLVVDQTVGGTPTGSSGDIYGVRTVTNDFEAKLESTIYGDFRSEIADGYSEGLTTQEIRENCEYRLDLRISEAVYELIDISNKNIESMSQLLEYNSDFPSADGPEVLYRGADTGDHVSISGISADEWDSVSDGNDIISRLDVGDRVAIGQVTLNLPVDLSELDRYGTDGLDSVGMRFIPYYKSTSGTYIHSPGLFSGSTPVDIINVDISEWELDESPLTVDMDGQDAYTVYPTHLYNTICDEIENVYKRVNSDLVEYVSAQVEALDQGQIDPTGLLGPSEIVAEYGDLNEYDRVIREIYGTGATPSDVDSRLRIDHPDVGDVFGDLLIDSSSEFTTAEGEQIAASDYDSAYFVYESDDGVEYEILDNSEPIEIIEIDRHVDVNTEEDVDVVEVDGDDVLELQGVDITDYDDEQYDIVVTDVNGDSETLQPSNFEYDDDDDVSTSPYPSSLAEYESSEFEASVGNDGEVWTTPVDPGTADDWESLVAENEELRDEVDELRERLDDDSGIFGGGVFGGGGSANVGLIGVIVGLVVAGAGYIASEGGDQR